MRFQLIPSSAEIQMSDTHLLELIGGEHNLDDFLNDYLPNLSETLQRNIEARDDLVVGDYGAALQLDASYGDYQFMIFARMKKIWKTGDLVQLAIEKLDFYSMEEGHKTIQQLIQQHGRDDMVYLNK